MINFLLFCDQVAWENDKYKNRVSLVIGNSLRFGIIHNFFLLKYFFFVFFFFLQTERHDSGREKQGLKFVAPKMGRIYSKIIAPIQPVRRQCVRVDKETLVEGWIDIYFFKHAFVQDGYVFIRKELMALYVSCGFSVVHGFIILSKRHK